MDDLEWMQECEKRVAEASREALERAAKVCDQNSEPDMHPEVIYVVKHIAERIRALISPT